MLGIAMISHIKAQYIKTVIEKVFSRRHGIGRFTRTLPAMKQNN